MPEQREAAFIARITASTAHEFRNVLSIVKESAGLMEDLLRASGEGGVAPSARLLELADLIGAQVDRGAGIVTDLHRLAHSLDPAPPETAVLPVLERTSSFCQRFARERKQRVAVGDAPVDFSVTLGALPLHMVLFTTAEYCMGQLPEGGALTMSPGLNGGRRGVEFVGVAGDGALVGPASGGPEWSELSQELAALGAAVEAGEGEFRLWVGLPGVGAG